MKVDVVATQPNPTAAFLKIVCCNALKEVEKQTRKKLTNLVSNKCHDKTYSILACSAP